MNYSILYCLSAPYIFFKKYAYYFRYKNSHRKLKIPDSTNSLPYTKEHHINFQFVYNPREMFLRKSRENIFRYKTPSFARANSLVSLEIEMDKIFKLSPTEFLHNPTLSHLSRSIDQQRFFLLFLLPFG